MALGPVMLDLAGTELSAEERERLRHPLAGGVILFSRNYESRQQLEQLVRAIHSLREPPLLVAVDHEGGRVQRFREGFSPLPPVRHLGYLHDENPRRAQRLAEACGWLMASELRAVGVDFSFAPVLDLDRGVSEIIGDRAFHSDPETVAELARAYVHGMTRAGMAATGKHFPGHGGVAGDSHLDLPVDPRRLADLLLEDLVPFERMIGHGLAAIMPAHVLYPRIDAQPAGYSRFWLQEVLRGRLGFQGAIFSDDLSMAGAAGAGNAADRARAALAAGCDMALICNDPGAAGQVLERLQAHGDPASHLRLARMHGRHGSAWVQLAASRDYQDALRMVQNIA